MASVKHFVIDQGITFNLTINVSDAVGNPLDLTGYELRSQMRKSYASNSFVAFTVVSDNPEEGDLTISLTASQTSALKSGRYVYDIEIEDQDEVVTRVLEGIITVTPEVTR
jgi:hypothetical protein